MTLKMHIIIDHCRDYFELTGKTLCHTNAEFVESFHYSIKHKDITHDFKMKRCIGTPIDKTSLIYDLAQHQEGGVNSSLKISPQNS